MATHSNCHPFRVTPPPSSYLHIHVDANALELAECVCVSTLCCHVDTGLSLVITNAGSLKESVQRNTSHQLLQTLGGAEPTGNVQRCVPLVVGELQRSSPSQQFLYHLHLLSMGCDVEGSLIGRKGGRVDLVSICPKGIHREFIFITL